MGPPTFLLSIRFIMNGNGQAGDRRLKKSQLLKKNLPSKTLTGKMSQRETSKKTTATTTVIMVTTDTMDTTNQRRKVCQPPSPSNLPSSTLFWLLNSGSWAPLRTLLRKLSNLHQKNNQQLKLNNRFQLSSRHQLLSHNQLLRS